MSVCAGSNPLASKTVTDANSATVASTMVLESIQKDETAVHPLHKLVKAFHEINPVGTFRPCIKAHDAVTFRSTDDLRLAILYSVKSLIEKTNIRMIHSLS
jgi:hypothetical protein